jgi:hypothetical protein
MSTAIEMTGQKFGMLLVIERAGKEKHGTALWKAECECGQETIVRGAHLRSGRIMSCGCLMGNTTHGHTAGGRFSPTFTSWDCMKQRCLNPNHKHFSYYGGRGITVCQSWTNSFEQFLSDVGERPEGKTLDRIDSNGNYEKSNVRWATPKEQANNKRDL